MRKSELAKILKQGITTQQEANLIWEAYEDHLKICKQLLETWGKWAKNASKI